MMPTSAIGWHCWWPAVIMRGMDRTSIVRTIAESLDLPSRHVTNAVELLDDGNTIPFIARYRKEATGSLDEAQLRVIAQRADYLHNLQERKTEVLRLIDGQDRLTPELEDRIEEAESLQEVDDLYRPFRPKRRTRAGAAVEKGLDPLAETLWQLAAGEQPPDGVRTGVPPEELAHPFISDEHGVESEEDALAGAGDIIAQRIADDSDTRGFVRRWTRGQGRLKSTIREEGADTDSTYTLYHDYEEPLARIKPHRVLAINRGEREKVLMVKVEVPHEPLLKKLCGRIIRHPKRPAAALVTSAVQDGYNRLLSPSVERELRAELTLKAEDRAIEVFADNLENLLLQAPVRGKTVMGIDPAYRTGCKVAVVDPSGRLLDISVIYPAPPRSDRAGARRIVLDLIQRHGVDIIAIGNGTASRETETFIAEEIISGQVSGAPNEGELHYTIVNEAGASVYSASPLARDEFPDLDVSERSAVSIARRLQDPLAELVKIEPRSIGVGQYQHDVNQKRLEETLEFVVELCVNRVGVDLATASAPLLGRVSGIGPAAASAIIHYRDTQGIEARADLLRVSGIGPRTFEQCAGFLRLPDGGEPLDATAIHPESYAAAYQLLEKVGAGPADVAGGGLPDIDSRLRGVNRERMAGEIDVGLPTLQDIIEALKRPGRDPREDMPGPIFRSDVLSFDDLKPGMTLPGTVRNVVDFGAFVDIGVKHDGLVHISELTEEFVRHPSDVVSVGDNVQVMVLEVDHQRGRIRLTMRYLEQPGSSDG